MYNDGKTLLIAQMYTEPPDKYIHKINIQVKFKLSKDQILWQYLWAENIYFQPLFCDYNKETFLLCADQGISVGQIQ